MMFHDICASLLERTDRAPLINGHAVKIGEIYKVVPSKNINDIPKWLKHAVPPTQEIVKYAKDFSFIYTTTSLSSYIIWLKDSDLPLVVKPIKKEKEFIMCKIVRGADMNCACVLNNMNVRPLSPTLGRIHAVTQNQHYPLIPLSYNNGFARYTKEEQASVNF